MYRFSIIDDSRITAGKAGNIGEVDRQVSASSLDLFAQVACRRHICCAICSDLKRNNASFKSIDFLQFDFDSGDTWESVSNALLNIDHVILASKNHLKDKGDGKGAIPRFHLFLPLKQPITSVAIYSFTITFYMKLMKSAGFTADSNAKDAVRYFYKHSKILKISNTGRTIDNDMDYQEMYADDLILKEYNEQRQQEQNQSASIETIEQLLEKLRKTKYFKHWNFSVSGNRWEQFLQFLGVCSRMNAPKQLVISVINSLACYSTNKDHQFTKDKVHTFINRKYKK